MKTKFNKYDYLVVLLISTLVLGEVYQLIKIIGLLSVIYVLFNFSKEYYQGYKRVKIFIILLIFFNFTSLLWSQDYELWHKNIVNLISLSFDFMLLVTLASKARNPIRSIIYGWIILVLCTIPIALWEISSNFHLSALYADRDIYIQGDLAMQKKFAAVTFGNLNSYTTLLSVSLPIVISLVFSKLNLALRIIIIAFFLAVTYIIITNSSRGGVFSLAVIAFVFLCFYWKYLKRTFWNFFFGFVAVIIVYYYSDSVMAQFEQRLISKGEVLSDSGRSNMLNFGLDIFLNNFWGIGVGDMAYHYSNYPTSGLLIPHNLFMEFLLYGGLIFFLLFIFWFVKIYYRGFKSESKVIRFIFKASAVSMLPASVINSGYFFLPYIWLFFASIYILSNEQKYDDRLL